MYKKTNPKQIKEMKKLHKQGWNYVEIGKIFKLSPRTVNLHINNKKGIIHKRDGIGDNPEEIPLFIRQNIEKAKPKIYDKDKCQICGAEKEWKFRFTNFCSLDCFKLYGTQ